MRLILDNLGKRFNRQWIFRKLNFTFDFGKAYAITGANGSGKSTLMQVIAGAVQNSEGVVKMLADGGWQLAVDGKPSVNKNILSAEIEPEYHFQHISIAAPYLELIEEFSLVEFLQFHFEFKTILSGQTIDSIIEIIGLKDAAHKQIRQYSSGMKQRVKLAQAIFSNVPIILLDEPTSNLDANGIALYHQLIQDFCLERLLIICSNDENEISFCSERIDISIYKNG